MEPPRPMNASTLPMLRMIKPEAVAPSGLLNTKRSPELLANPYNLEESPKPAI